MTDMLDTEYWRDYAACKGETAGLFHPDYEDRETVRLAKSICRTCPVATECLKVALENGEPDGIWGGYTPEERELIRIANQYPKRKPPVVEFFPHGTNAGHRRHIRAGTPPCDACLRAHNLVRRQSKDRRRK